MNKIAHVAIAAAASILLLAGCSSVSAEAVAKATPTPSVSSTPSPQSSSEPSATPITMQPTGPDNRSEAQKAGFKDENDWYLRSIKSSWSGELPGDEQLLGAATFACDAISHGAAPVDVVAVKGDGEDAANNNRNVVQYAVMAICPKSR